MDKINLSDFFKLFINLTDRVLPSLSSTPEMIVYLHFFSHSLAVGEDTCRKSYKMLSDLTKLSPLTVKTAVRGLIGKGLLTIVKPGAAKSPATYRVHFPHELSRITRLQRDPDFILHEAGSKDHTTAGIIAMLDPFDRERLMTIIATLTEEQAAELRRKAQEMARPGDDPETKFHELVLLKKFGPDRIRKYQKLLALKGVVHERP